jgi:hypothetical protein
MKRDPHSQSLVTSVTIHAWRTFNILLQITCIINKLYQVLHGRTLNVGQVKIYSCTLMNI